MRSAVLWVALCACGDVGEFSPPERFVTIDKDAPGGLTVNVANNFLNYSIRFHDGDVKLPDQLTVRGEQVLGIDTSNECQFESLIGVAVFPALVGTANTMAEQASSTIDIVLDHPAIATIHVNYNLPYQCPDSQVLTGDATFTMFASGRIVRQDTSVIPSSTTLMEPSTGTQMCGCAEAQGTNDRFTFTSFWAFDPTNATNFDDTGAPAMDGHAAYCTITPTHALAVNWSGSTTRIQPNQTASHVFDFANSVASIDPANGVGNVFSALQIDPTANRTGADCHMIVEQLIPHNLSVATVDLSTDNDGIYRDSNPHPDPFELVATDGTIPAGFAVSVDLGGSQHARITPDIPFTRPPVIAGEGENGDRFTIYFHDGLPANKKITIEPL